jgi:tetratricopeptide (TPR) repeat protein
MEIVSRARLIIAVFAALLSALAVGQDRPIVPVNRWALVIGASAYAQDIGPLKYTAREARLFAGELEKSLGIQAANIKLLADGGTPEEAPTALHIVQALDTLLADPRLDKANLFVFYFSGHGVATPKGDFLLPSDVKPDRIEEMGVPVSQVIDKIVRAGLKNVLFIADACRAGTANKFGAEFYELCRRANIAVILGCAPGMSSYEYPQLKSGVFTHFLIKSLSNAELRDGAGTVWAGKLGQEVQKQVHDYTEPDYGKFAQVPTLWAEQSTLDVLLATYPKEPVTDIAVQVFKKSAEKLQPEEFAAAMTGYGAELMQSGRHDQAVELLKAVDQQGLLSPFGRYLLGTALVALHRGEEADRVLAPLQKGPDGFFKDLALTSTASRVVPPDLRVQAAERLFKTDPEWTTKMLALAVVRACGSHDQQLQLARKFAALKPPDARKGFYAQAVLADIEGRWSDSISAFEKALTTPADLPRDRELYFGLLRPISARQDPNALEKWADRGLRIKGCEAAAYLEKAFLAKERGDAKARVENLRRALKQNPDPDELWQAAKTAGVYMSDLKHEFKQAAARHPYAWRARLIIGLVSGGDGGVDAGDTFLATLTTANLLTVNAEQFDLLASMYEEAVALGKMTQADYRLEIDTFFLGLLRSAPQFGYDHELWQEFARFGELNERNTQVRVAFAKYLPFKPESVPTALRPILLLTALNSGDDDRARTLSALNAEPAEGDDLKWLYAAYLATRGREPEAIKLIATLRLPSKVLKSRMDALQTYLLAKSGRAAQARTRLKATSNDFVVRAFNGLAWAALGDWKRAEPLLTEHVKSHDWGFLFVSARAMRVLDQHHRSSGRIADAQNVALSASTSQPGNPLFGSFTFAAKPGLAQFAGALTFNCVVQDDILCIKSLGDEGKKTFGFGKLTITTLPTGAVDASFTDEQGNKYPFTGKVDSLGNFRGQAKLGLRVFQVASKLAPPRLYKTFPGLKSIGPIFELVDADGYRVIVACRP